MIVWSVIYGREFLSLFVFLDSMSNMNSIHSGDIGGGFCGFMVEYMTRSQNLTKRNTFFVIIYISELTFTCSLCSPGNDDMSTGFAITFCSW